MSISANIQTDVNGDIIVELKGALEYESGHVLREELYGLVLKYPIAIITLDFSHIEFVGSSGIGKFVETYNFLKEKTENLRIRHIQPEFIKVFKLYNLVGIESLIEQSEADSNTLVQFNKVKKSYSNNI